MPGTGLDVSYAEMNKINTVPNSWTCLLVGKKYKQEE